MDGLVCCGCDRCIWSYVGYWFVGDVSICIDYQFGFVVVVVYFVDFSNCFDLFVGVVWSSYWCCCCEYDFGYEYIG